MAWLEGQEALVVVEALVVEEGVNRIQAMA